ncbi:Interleukin-1 beta [Oryzias melastigma]|uniref:Interleukin-1 n=1 Tax=Oryzias melastigma TaxID=30732 RepID=A0A834FAL6_ORYME|nr:Interleukin-1 beta [Oryzias melastigma]
MESKMTCSKSDMYRMKMSHGLHLEISHHPLTMRSVVNLIIAIDRLKAGRMEEVIGTDFRDENLLNVMLESILEGTSQEVLNPTQVTEKAAATSTHTALLSERHVAERSSAPSQFSRTGEYQCSVTDRQKRSLVLVKNSMKLLAVMLQGGSDSRKVQLNMSTYLHRDRTPEARPVALGIKDTKLYLSCHQDGDKPTLFLEEVEDNSSLSTIGQESENVRFLFYKQDTGGNLSTLTSARYPGWYISTATVDSEPVEMCQESDSRFRNFHIRQS